MNPPKRPSTSLFKVIVTQACALIASTAAWAQQAPAQQPSASAPSDSTAATPAPADVAPATPADTVQLNPFEVVEDNKGYYQGSSMSGTRFNSKLEDMGASLTVVTKQQMEDFAMLDINDVFLYVGNTMGTGTFTDYTIDRNGSVSDNVQLNPTQANRVRGLSAANISFNNFETMGRVPVDPLNIDGVEVSRGPNASVFGLGNAGGTVNMVAASALLFKNTDRVQSRVDNYGGYRESLDVNRTLIKGKLAIRGSAAFQHDAFERKPSGVNSVRENGMIKYQPFSKTTITGSVSWYRMDGNRPNFSPPRDNVSYWLASGKPTWNPVAMTISVGGQTLGPYTASTYAGPDYFQNTFVGNNHSIVEVDQNGLGYWTAPTTFTNTLGPVSGGQVDRYMATSPASGTNLGKFTNQPLFSTTPSVSNKAIYDWSDINIAAVNYDMDSELASNAQIDQVFFDTPLQSLSGQASVFREDAKRYQRNLVGVANDNGQSGQLYVNVNQFNLDGTPNQYFLKPYIGTDAPRTTLQPAKWTTYRAQLAYKLDFTTEKDGLLKWLGRHELAGYDEYKYRINRQYSFRDTITNSVPWIPAGLSRGNQSAIAGGPAAGLNIAKNYFEYYLGNNSGTGQIQYAPTNYAYGNYTYVWGNSATGVFNHENDTLGQVAVTDASGGSSNVKTILKTAGTVLQSHFADDLLVTTLGEREDKVYTKFGNTPQQLNPDGETFNYATLNSWAAGDYRFNSGKTDQAGAVLRPFRDLGFLHKTVSELPLGSEIDEVLRSMSVYLNRSNSFIPQAPAQDILGNPLPNTIGHGEDYGLEFTALHGTLHVRLNHYIDTNKDARNGDASTLSTRVIRLDLQTGASDTFPLVTQATAWVTALNPGFSTAQVQATVAQEIGLTTAQQANLFSPNPPLAATQDITGTGTELEINYNPTRFWTVSANASDSHVINSNVSTGLSTWIAQRMPIWTTIVDPRTNTLWWTTNYGGSQTASQNFAAFVQAPYDIIQQQSGKSNPQNPEYNFRVSNNFQLAGIFDNPILKKFNVTAAVRYQSRYAIGYYGAQQLPAVITSLDANHPIWGDKDYWHIDAGLGYRTTMYDNKIRANISLLCRDLLEPGHLQPIGAYPDGTPNTYRIIDPRQFIMQVSFDM